MRFLGIDRRGIRGNRCLSRGAIVSNEMRRLTNRLTNMRVAMVKLRDMWPPPHGFDARSCNHPICTIPRIANDALKADEEAANENH